MRVIFYCAFYYCLLMGTRAAGAESMNILSTMLKNVFQQVENQPQLMRQPSDDDTGYGEIFKERGKVPLNMHNMQAAKVVKAEQDAAQEAMKAATETRMLMEQALQEAAKKAAREAMRHVAQQAAKEAVRLASQQSVQQAVREASKNAVENAAEKTQKTGHQAKISNKDVDKTAEHSDEGSMSEPEESDEDDSAQQEQEQENKKASKKLKKAKKQAARTNKRLEPIETTSLAAVEKSTKSHVKKQHDPSPLKPLKQNPDGSFASPKMLATVLEEIVRGDPLAIVHIYGNHAEDDFPITNHIVVRRR